MSNSLDHALAALKPIPTSLDWLEQNLLVGRQRVAEYVCHVAKQRGITAIEEEPRLYVGTCHSFKGSEADAVWVFPNLSWQAHVGALQSIEDHDAVTRLFYVAGTRAKSALHWCAPVSGACIQP